MKVETMEQNKLIIKSDWFLQFNGEWKRKICKKTKHSPHQFTLKRNNQYMREEWTLDEINTEKYMDIKLSSERSTLKFVTT